MATKRYKVTHHFVLNHKDGTHRFISMDYAHTMYVHAEDEAHAAGAAALELGLVAWSYDEFGYDEVAPPNQHIIVDNDPQLKDVQDWLFVSEAPNAE